MSRAPLSRIRCVWRRLASPLAAAPAQRRAWPWSTGRVDGSAAETACHWLPTGIAVLGPAAPRRPQRLRLRLRRERNAARLSCAAPGDASRCAGTAIAIADRCRLTWRRASRATQRRRTPSLATTLSQRLASTAGVSQDCLR